MSRGLYPGGSRSDNTGYTLILREQVGAVRHYAGLIDAVNFQRGWVHALPPLGLWGGPTAQRFLGDPKREMDDNLEVLATFLKPDDVLVDAVEMLGGIWPESSSAIVQQYCCERDFKNWSRMSRMVFADLAARCRLTAHYRRTPPTQR